VAAADVESGRWRVNPEVAATLGVTETYLQRHLLHYTRTLEAGAKYQLTVWPYHAMLGGIGHALVSAVEEAIFFHGIARFSQPPFQVKGNQPLTEHYSMLGPEVAVGADGELFGSRNQPLIDELLEFDAVVVAGQAKSHCVAWTIDDLLGGLADRNPELVRKLYLLEDCTSPVVVRGVVDYTFEADEAFRRFEAAGMHVVRSTDPIETWPGLAAVAR
jgi:nicotinamidase-related amidase